MADKDYTAAGEIVRGGRWPPADQNLGVQLTKTAGWPSGADGWTWELLLSLVQEGGTPSLEVEASSAVLSESDTVMTLGFSLTAAETATLPGTGARRFRVDIRSTNGAVVSYYDVVEGFASVRDPVGEAV